MPLPRVVPAPAARPTAPAPAPVAPVTIVLTVPWPDPREPDAAPLTHLQWAERVARQVAVSSLFGFGWSSQEADDLVAVAWATLAMLAPRLDAARVRSGSSPDQLFRGWAMRWVRGECRREGERLVNGGWYSTTDDPALKAHARANAGGLPADARCPTCTEVFFGRGQEDDEEGEGVAPVATRFEPRLVITRGGVARGEQKAPPG